MSIPSDECVSSNTNGLFTRHPNNAISRAKTGQITGRKEVTSTKQVNPENPNRMHEDRSKAGFSVMQNEIDVETLPDNKKSHAHRERSWTPGHPPPARERRVDDLRKREKREHHTAFVINVFTQCRRCWLIPNTSLPISRDGRAREGILIPKWSFRLLR